eukprot:3239076-Rhodomonas_salina.1
MFCREQRFRFFFVLPSSFGVHRFEQIREAGSAARKVRGRYAHNFYLSLQRAPTTWPRGILILNSFAAIARAFACTGVGGLPDLRGGKGSTGRNRPLHVYKGGTYITSHNFQ